MDAVLMNTVEELDNVGVNLVCIEVHHVYFLVLTF
jgi:hypothetical protein